MENIKWKILREQFYKECTTETPQKLLLKKVNLAPHDLFEWFRTNIDMLCEEDKKPDANCSGLEEKLQEILTDHLEDIERSRTEQTNLIARMKFYQTHKFAEEEIITRVKFDATAMIIYGWEKMHKEIQELLNKWLS